VVVPVRGGVVGFVPDVVDDGGDGACQVLAGGEGAGRGEQAASMERLCRFVVLAPEHAVGAVIVARAVPVMDRPCRVLDGRGGRPVRAVVLSGAAAGAVGVHGPAVADGAVEVAAVALVRGGRLGAG